MEKIKCIGCGSTIQTTDESKLGYVQASTLEKGTENLLCKRCFRLKHYNELPDITMTSDEFKQVLGKIAEEDALIVKVVDLFDFSGSMISGLNRFVGNNDILLVGNKRDLLPKAVKPLKIQNWMRRLIKDYGLQVIDTVLTSAEKGHGIDELIDMIETYRKGRNVYIVGCTNVGKSTLVNAVIKRFTEQRDDVITVSKFPGTTIDFIEIPLDDKSFLIDTPGIVNEHQYAHFLDKASLKWIYPKKEVKAKIYQLNDKQSLFFAGLARIDYVNGEQTSFVCYFNNEINIHRTKLEKADELFNRHVGELFTPPTPVEYERMGTYRKHNFKLPIYKCDIVISGLGFITIEEPNAQISVHVPSQVGVYLRPSLF
jgi:30S ribosome assembly GTPase